MVEGIVDMVMKEHCWIINAADQGAESGLRKRKLKHQLKLKNPPATEEPADSDHVPALGSTATPAEVSANDSKRSKKDDEQAGWDALGEDLFASDVDE